MAEIDDVLTVTSGGDQTTVAAAPPADSSMTADIPGDVQALVKEWNAKINDAKSDVYEKEFKQARECMQIARDGGPKEWTRNKDNVVVPILNRHINTQVAALYAKDPKARAKRKKRLMHTVWDGTVQTLNQAMQAAMQAAQMASQGIGLGPDPQALAIVQDAMQVKQYDIQIDNMGKTMEALWDYFLNEQGGGYRVLFKAQVRRTKVCGWSWVKLGFQRILQPRPEAAAGIDDATMQVAEVQRLMEDAQEGEIQDDSADSAQLKYSMQQMATTTEIVAREGPVFDFPSCFQIIVDPDVTHMKSLTGAWWVCHEWDMTPEQVQSIYKVDLGGQFAGYVKKKDGSEVRTEQADEKKGKQKNCKVREVWDKKLQQVFTIVDGYPGFIKEPAAPDVQISRFFPFFPLIFNECEDEDRKFPPSDIWQARHAQEEYNRSRQALREHRRQNRPFYIGPAGVLEKEDKEKLAAHESGEFIELLGLQPGQDVKTAVSAFVPAPIDPKLYDVEAQYNDLLRTVGTQQANLGEPGGKTATESSIAENSRKSTIDDNVDDLNEMLSALARSTGELMLLNMSKEKVVEIVGPGAVWPDMPQSRIDVAKEIELDIKAGSNGKPNTAIELQNLQLAWPIIQALPGFGPTPLIEKICELLNIDLEAAMVANLPSIVAINAMAQKLALGGGAGAPAGAGGPSGAPPSSGGPPQAQGANGAAAAPPPSAPDMSRARGQGQMNPAPRPM